ncbi:MAG: WYL domain-containing protein [Prevotella sp.]|nr:WYL domain-containing protein [Prevotella sp.]
MIFLITEGTLIVLNYLRTLPLHHSQRELESGDHYTDFSFDIRPTDDLLDKLFSYRDSIEVLEPADLPDF